MKRYLLASIFMSLLCGNFISTPIQGMEKNKIASALAAPAQFIGNNMYPLACLGAACFVGGYATLSLFNYWKDREKIYEVDGRTKVVVRRWICADAREYVAEIKNKFTNECYGQLIYQLQPLDVIYIKRLVIEPNYRKQELGSKLLQTVLDKLPSLYGCKKVTLYACPMELKKEEDRQQMLPKLIKFYEKQGAKVLRTGDMGIWMVIDLAKQA